MGEYFDKCAPESIDIFALNSNYLKTVAGERLGDLIAFEILGRVSGNGDIVVINDELHIQALRNCQASRLGIISFLLRAVRTKTENSFVAIGERDAVDHGPHVSEATRGEFDTWRKTELRVTWKFRFSCSVMQEVLRGDMSFERGEKVLRCDAVTCTNTLASENPASESITNQPHRRQLGGTC